jgi:glucose/mannose-6-phosphate isomerase
MPNLILDSLKHLPEQFNDCLKQTANFRLPKNYRKINQIVVGGMGGSNLASRIAASVFSQELKLPLIINADYEVPAFINRDTLFIASSYSGTTEETLHAYGEAKKRQAKIAVLTAAGAGNRLAELAKKDGCPLLAYTAEANPSGQPRLGLGYALIGLLAILREANALKISSNNLSAAITKLANSGAKLVPEKSNNLASKLADQVSGKNIIIVAGPFLAGSAHTLRNQFNETAKNLAAYLVLPEMNHYALEGLAHPASNKNDVVCLFFESSLYSPRVAKRLELTKQVVAKNKIKVVSTKLTSKNKLEQALEMLALGAWLSYYLALTNKVNPTTIPWVDWFKKELR